METIYAYIDGATRGNQFEKNLGAWGVILSYCGHEKHFSDVIENTTNQVCELSAAIQALTKITNKEIPVIVESDSQYVVQGINEWSKNWLLNGWKNANGKNIENQGLWLWLLDLIKEFKDITFIKTEGHVNNNNIRVDKLCNMTMDNFKRNT